MKFLRTIFNAIFGSKDAVTPINLPDEVGNAPVSLPADIGQGLKIALVMGHGGNDCGAEGNGTTEIAYNGWVMDFVEEHTSRNLKCFKGSSSISAVAKSLPFIPDVTIQMHLNAYNGAAYGCEVLVVEGDNKSYPLAERFASEFSRKFNHTMRRPQDQGKKILSKSDRGASSLKASVFGVKILVEPFFIDNTSDFVAKEKYAQFLLEFVESL